MPSTPILESSVGHRQRRPTTVLAWVLLVVILGVSTAAAAGSSFTDRPLLGDQASFVLQTISLTAWPPDLSYDEADIAEWHDLGWTQSPNGLLFQRRSDGYAAAKPFGYSAVAAPVSGAIGVERGMAIVNAALLLTTVGIAYLLLRRRFGGATLPIIIAAFTISSVMTLYLFILQPDLFLAAVTSVMVLLLVEADRLERYSLLVVAMIPAALLIAERTPTATLVAPLMIWVIWRAPTVRYRAASVGTLITTWALFVSPYLIYSDGASWSAYGGNRWYLISDSPWPPTDDRVFPATGSGFFSWNYVTGRLSPASWDDAGLALVGTVAGRYTGMLPWAPMVLAAVVVIGFTRPWRQPRNLGSWLWASGLTYVIAHAVLLPDGYYGGGATIGNKYLLHITPVFIAAFALAPVTRRSAQISAGIALTVGILMTGPQLLHPDRGLEDIDQTTIVQRLLPYEDYANPRLCHRNGC